MTREEAITVFKAFMDNPLFSDVHKAAFNIAIHDIKQRHDWDINKLMLVPKTEWEQEPTTKNDLGVDLVSRADVLKLMQDNWHTHNGDWAMQESMDDIRALPSVTPQEPRKGHWIVEKGGSYLGQRNACCSNCKDFYTNDWNVMNYCPNCGADMREVKE